MTTIHDVNRFETNMKHREAARIHCWLVQLPEAGGSSPEGVAVLEQLDEMLSQVRLVLGEGDP